MPAYGTVTRLLISTLCVALAGTAVGCSLDWSKREASRSELEAGTEPVSERTDAAMALDASMTGVVSPPPDASTPVDGSTIPPSSSTDAGTASDASTISQPDAGVTLIDCEQGFEQSGNVCIDVDECLLDATRCRNGGVCTNVLNGGGYSCSGCSTGFVPSMGPQPTCVNFNECANAGICSHGGICTDAAPGYTCSNCKAGFVSSGGTFPVCVDVDECDTPTQCGQANGFGQCINSVGAYACTCNSGRTGALCDLTSQCTGANLCTVNFPCIEESPPAFYRCAGKYPEWTLPLPATRFSYTDSVVADAHTGLKWQRLMWETAGSCNGDRACALLASSCGTDAACTWDEAKQYCRNLDGILPGLGWRLPTVAELISILDLTQRYPAMDASAFPAAPNRMMWSSTLYAPVEGDVWYVSFAEGGSFATNFASALHVRCVR